MNAIFDSNRQHFVVTFDSIVLDGKVLVDRCLDVTWLKLPATDSMLSSCVSLSKMQTVILDGTFCGTFEACRDFISGFSDLYISTRNEIERLHRCRQPKVTDKHKEHLALLQEMCSGVDAGHSVSLIATLTHL